MTFESTVCLGMFVALQVKLLKFKLHLMYFKFEKKLLIITIVIIYGIFYLTNKLS